MKKALFIGRSGCGKTTITQVLNNMPMIYHKTQALSYNAVGIDSPGEYLENTRYINALIVASYDCDIIFLIQSAVDDNNSFPPNFANIFSKEVYGIVTKIDLEYDLKLDYAGKLLGLAGVRKVFYTSAYDHRGIEEIGNLIAK